MQKLLWLIAQSSIILQTSAQETPPCTWADSITRAQCLSEGFFDPKGRFIGPTSPRREASLLNLAGFLTRLFFLPY